MIYDSIIIGKGPAGISAAIYLKRFGFNPLVIGKDGGALEKAHLIENYYGIDSISGNDLIEKGINQAKRLGIEVLTEEVIDISFFDNLTVTTKNNMYQAKTIVLALGASRNRYAKADKFEGVSYCATCDGFFYRKKRLALIGNTSYMKHELDVLSNISNDITIFTDGLDLEVEIEPKFRVITDKITDIKGDERIKSIVAGNIEVEVDGAFIAKGNASGFTIAKHLGIALDNNSIIVDKDFMTNIPGIFACGDIIGGLLQVSKAVSDGALCASGVNKFLKN
jgi:thioredoxin reductase (NADPH)